MPQTLLQLLGRGALERQAHPHARAQGQEILGAEALDEALIAGEHDGRAAGASPSAPSTTGAARSSTVELHFLAFIGDQHRAAQRGIDMPLPARPQHLGAAIAVVRMQLDAEQLAHLAVEVGHARLRPR